MSSIEGQEFQNAEPCSEDGQEFQDAELFSEDEHTKLRRLVPLVQQPDITFLNASYQHPMNTRVRTALDNFLNQASTHPHPKPLWQKTTAESREKLAQFLNVPSHSIAFTRDTTEGLNLFQRSLKFSTGDNAVILDNEHPNQAYGWLALRDHGLDVRLVPTKADCYAANANTFAPHIDERTIAIGLSSVMFHSGQKNDIKDICQRFRPRGVHVLVDITQHIGVEKIDLTDWNVSAAAFSTHKALGCPTGLGALYVAPTVLPTLNITPPIVGAGSIANLSPDLIPNPDIVYHSTAEKYEHLNLSLLGTTALNAALSLIVDEIGIGCIERHLRALGRELISQMDGLGLRVIGSRREEEHAPHVYIVPLLHPDWKAHFAAEKVYVSHYRCGVRVSFGWYNNIGDVRRFADSVRAGIASSIAM